jgi:hypothetical protein
MDKTFLHRTIQFGITGVFGVAALVGCTPTTRQGVPLSEEDRRAYRFLEEGMRGVAKEVEEARFAAGAELRGDRRESVVQEMATLGQEVRRVQQSLASQGSSPMRLQKDFSFLSSEFSRIRDGLVFYRAPQFLQSRWQSAQDQLVRVEMECERTLCFNRGSLQSQDLTVDRYGAESRSVAPLVQELYERVTNFHQHNRYELREADLDQVVLEFAEDVQRAERDLGYSAVDRLEGRRIVEDLLESGQRTARALSRGPRFVKDDPDWQRTRELLRELEGVFRDSQFLK